MVSEFDIKIGNQYKIEDINVMKRSGVTTCEFKASTKMAKIKCNKSLQYEKVTKMKKKSKLYRIVNLKGRVYSKELINKADGTTFQKLEIGDKQNKITVNLWYSNAPLKKKMSVELLGMKIGIYKNEYVLHEQLYTKIKILKKNHENSSSSNDSEDDTDESDENKDKDSDSESETSETGDTTTSNNSNETEETTDESSESDEDSDQ